MTKFLKITPVKGYSVVVPDAITTRRHYERLNAAEKEPQYKIEEATEEEVAEFNAGKRPTPTLESLKVSENEALENESLKVENEDLKAENESLKSENEVLRLEIESLRLESKSLNPSGTGGKAKK
ncbi:MAG: hypothetical protein LBS43_12545 [Prevotellaceae bacterium]|jgi:predicted RNase H-like nuclease (RuvC/YqgF family)|nr:hypothetical protein [Prevotellaceae bacterium]